MCVAAFLGLTCQSQDHKYQGLRYSIYKSFTVSITKTYLYNTDPFKPRFYIVKLGLTGVYINFLISAKNIDWWYSLEPPRRGGSNEYRQSMFLQKYEK